MDAKALICDEQQNFSLTAVVLDDPTPDQVAIRTHFTGVSIGTEFGLISGKISKMNRNPFPLCTGYQGTGTIEAVGADIDNFAVGDEVYFRGNDAMRLADGTEVGCVSGGHCSRVVTRPNTTHGVAKMVPGAGNGCGEFVCDAGRGALWRRYGQSAGWGIRWWSTGWG